MSQAIGRLQQKVISLEKNYKYSARKYSYYNQLISVPSIAITSLSSVFSFMSTSEYIDGHAKNYCIIGVAMLTAISSMLQTVNTSCEFNVKKMKFTEASQQFDLLTDRVFFEIQNPNETNFVNDIEEEIEKIKNQCKFIPLEVKEEPERTNLTTI